MGIRRWNSIFGFIFGLFLSWLIFGGNKEAELNREEENYEGKEGGIQLAENWERIILEQKHEENGQNNFVNQHIKLNRPRFAATELGIRPNILIFLLARTSTAASLYQLLSPKVPVKILVSAGKFAASDFPVNSLPVIVRSDPVSLLNAIANISLNNPANWYLLLPDSTFINIYELERLINSLLWNSPVAFGWNINEIKNKNQNEEDGGHCLVEAGILFSSPAMNVLAQGRHLCNGLALGSSGNGENFALETCIRLAANLSCVSTFQGYEHRWWRVSSDDQQSLSPSIHGLFVVSTTSDWNFRIFLYQPYSWSRFKFQVEGRWRRKKIHAWGRGKNFFLLPVLRNISFFGLYSSLCYERPITNQIERLALLPLFNKSLTISPLLSELDISALTKHFLNVEFIRTEEEIRSLEEETEKYYSKEETEWPIGIMDASKPLNRFQAPVWELVTSDWKRFSNNPEESSADLSEDEREEWTQVFNEALTKSRCLNGGAKFVEGYKHFNPTRGIDYLIDLDCDNEEIFERIQVSRPIHSTKLLEKVPYVKEDREIALLVPVETPAQIYSLHPLLRRILSICMSGAVEGRQLRVLVAARNVEALPLRLLGENLAEMRRRCRSMESDLLLLKPDPNYRTTIELAALDEAVDRFGQQNLFLLLSPFSDFQPDFLDRVRLNTIQHFQVFFPIGFTEFNQIVTGLTPKEAEAFVIHKDRGRFDSDDEWPVAALFGVDFASARILHPNARSVVTLFLNQSNVHIFRSVEPSLRIRPHLRVCTFEHYYPSIEQRQRCERRRRLALGTRAQLAKLFLLAITPSNGFA
ncbi:unnamed protein product [Meloidogyne enterolobii]|uniref:Uncharacterized protein n=1 Tax=Meloidogyne enterolobii TaxID=390850 RepID=A0ACB1AIZ9_MELEN